MPKSVWHAIGRYFLLSPDVELYVSALAALGWCHHAIASILVLLSVFAVAVTAHLFILNYPSRMDPLEPRSVLIDDLAHHYALFPDVVPQDYNESIRQMNYKALLDLYGDYTIQFAHHSTAIVIHLCFLKISGAIRSIEKARALGVMLEMIEGECTQRFRRLSAPEACFWGVAEGVVGGIIAGCVAAGCTVVHAGLRLYVAVKRDERRSAIRNAG